MTAMNCTEPDLITETDLQAYADGEDLPIVAAHLESCPACRERVVAYGQLVTGLQSLLWRQQCPPAEMLREYHADYLSTEQQRQIAAHVILCPYCAKELREFTIPVSEEATHESLWTRADKALAQVGLMVAQLVTPVDNLRPALRGETREVLLFEAGDTAVSLNVEPIDNGRFTLHGQILSTSPLTGQARLTAVNQSPQECALSPTGTFVLSDLFPDQYQLTITLPAQQIVLPALSIEV